MTAHLTAVLGRGVLDADTPVLTADDLGFTRGDGCFDSARVVVEADHARVVNITEHLDRLWRSATALEITPPARADVEALVHDALTGWTAPGEATMRLFLTRGRESRPEQGPTFLLTIAERTQRPTAASPLPRALRAVTLSTGRPVNAFRDAPWLLGGVKTLSYATQVAAVREARRRGADDAILVTTDGFALEGTTSGLVVMSDGVLRTPPTGDTGILASTTVDDVVDAARAAGREVRVEVIPATDLMTADGVFLVSSSRGPCPIVELDQQALPVNVELAREVAGLAGF